MNINDINKIDLESQNINYKGLFKTEEQNKTKQLLNQPSVIYIIFNT